MKHASKSVRLLGGSHLTTLVLALAVALLFFATLTDARYGHETAVQAYFGSLIATWSYPPDWPLGKVLSRCWIALPGGPLIALMAGLNLAFAGILHLRSVRKESSLTILHCGLLIVIAAYLCPLLRCGNGFAIAVTGGAISITGLLVHYALVKRKTAPLPSPHATPSCTKERLFLLVPLGGALLPIVLKAFGLGMPIERLNSLTLPLLAYALYGPATLVSLIAISKGERADRRLRWCYLSLLSSAIALHAFAVCTLAIIHARPPVTGLASVLLFAGLVAACTALVMETVSRQHIAALGGAIAGLSAVLLAYGMGGADTGAISPMIDKRLWLILHVVVIGSGYAAALLSVVFANIHIVWAMMSREHPLSLSLISLTKTMLNAALVLVSIGTFSGGIWAMSAWGRFWGWDPKENAALMLILWMALAIHAKRSRLVNDMGFIRLCAALGILLAWSVAGTNILGTGLHRYGYADTGLTGIGVYALAQAILVATSVIANARKQVRQ